MYDRPPYYISAYDLAVKRGFRGTLDEWLESLKGDQGETGKSAYQYAVEAGYQGTEESFRESQLGVGKSAYEYAVEGGYTGTVEEFRRMLAAEHLPLKGGTMQGSIAMSGNRITGLGTPVVDADCATKEYVDNGMQEMETAGKEYLDNVAEEAGRYIDSKKKAVTVTLPAAGWAENGQTVNVEGVTAGNTILVGYSPDSFESYSDAGIRCTGQGEGTLTFVCESTPDADVNVNVVILN